MISAPGAFLTRTSHSALRSSTSATPPIARPLTRNSCMSYSRSDQSCGAIAISLGRTRSAKSYGRWASRFMTVITCGASRSRCASRRYEAASTQGGTTMEATPVTLQTPQSATSSLFRLSLPSALSYGPRASSTRLTLSVRSCERCTSSSQTATAGGVSTLRRSSGRRGSVLMSFPTGTTTAASTTTPSPSTTSRSPRSIASSRSGSQPSSTANSTGLMSYWRSCGSSVCR
mmetsp:Transcript_1647/g.3568  ORF Transcript_1647/g.3568 Transcript_1647/m.3568 type:complete len:231 (-) Transcript_1647:605-1297(-)